MTAVSSFVLGLDLGTTNIKAVVVNNAGEIAGLGSLRFGAQRDDQGHCEIPPEHFISTVRQTIALACWNAQISATQIQGISYGSQANTFVLLDSSDAPKTPVIIWSDRRAFPLQNSLTRFLESEEFLRHTGFSMPVPELALSKLATMNGSDLFSPSKKLRFFSLSDYLIYLLTGEHVGDQATASLTGLWSQEKDCWWPEALEFTGLPHSAFPWAKLPGQQVGVVSSLGARLFGLTSGTLVAAGTLDHHAAAWGAGIGTVAPCSESSGTVTACLRLLPTRRVSKDYFLGPDLIPGHWYACAFSSFGASALEHYRDSHRPGVPIQDLLKEALDCEEGRGTGVTVRKILDQLNGELYRLLRMLDPETRPKAIIATGGGARSNLWLQLKATTLGISFLRTASPEPGAYGAAMIAAAASGWYNTVQQAAGDWVKVQDRFDPQPLSSYA
jgi:sugar (pentulose or hexulose) kinase